MRNAAVRSNLLVPEVREVMDIRQASDYLAISPDTLYKYASEGFVPAFKLGNRWRFKRSRLDEWMDRQSDLHAAEAEIDPHSPPCSAIQKKPVPAGELAGPDVPLVVQRNGELLFALETIVAQMLRLDPREQSLISFDAGGFKALQAEQLRLTAETAAEKVRRSGIPYAFPPMNSRERRQMHMAFRESKASRRPAPAKARTASSPSIPRARQTCRSRRRSSRAASGADRRCGGAGLSGIALRVRRACTLRRSE
jgi:excisionase family DNA binding protein